MVCDTADKGTLTPPSHTKPHPRVLLQFTTEGYAPNTRNGLQTLTHPSNALTYGQLKGWAAIATSGSQIHIWDYVGNACHATILMPDWYRAFLDVKLFGQIGVGGMMPEGQRGLTADLHELRSWVFASLYWDSSRDIDALVSEFLRGFYSPEAAPLVLEHMQAYWNFSRATGAWASPCGCDSMSNKCVTVPTLFTSYTALDTAIRAEVARNKRSVRVRFHIIRNARI